MLFGSKKKPVVKVNQEMLKQLAPFRQLSDQLATHIIKEAELIHLRPGAWIADKDWQGVYFLINGDLVISNNNQYHEIQANTSNAAYPLPVNIGMQFNARNNAVVMRLPERFLKLANTGDTQGKNGIEMHEGRVEDEIYLEFYMALQKGQCELPSMPDLAVRIGKAIDDPDTVNEDIARLIQMDPSLTTRIISVVNSAAFGGCSHIQNMQQAVARLGRQQIRNLVFSCIIRGLFRTDSPLLKQRLKDLWTHSAHVAALSSILAHHTPGLDPDRALLAGLIHDIGVVPILAAAKDYPSLLENPLLLDDAIGHLRAEIGAITLNRWKFEDDMINVTLHAEDWNYFGTAIPDYADIVLLAQLHSYVGTPRMMDLPYINGVPSYDKLALGKLSPENSIGILHDAKKEIQEVRQLLLAE